MRVGLGGQGVGGRGAGGQGQGGRRQGAGGAGQGAGGGDLIEEGDKGSGQRVSKLRDLRSSFPCFQEAE